MNNLIEKDDYFIDKFNNKWIKSEYNIEQATACYKSLVNCKDCLNCYNCSNSSNLENCTNCINCLNLSKCSDCKNWKNSSYSYNCCYGSNMSNSYDFNGLSITLFFIFWLFFGFITLYIYIYK